MSELKKNKAAGTFATILIGLIILAFMFTGYQQFEGGGTVANVGSVSGMPIKPEEFQSEYNRQVEFYKQIMGGDLTAKQIEDMRVKEMALKNIVQRKLMVKLANDIGTFPADEEVTTEIKALPYFQSNGQFNINQYKAILAQNRLTPLEFEKDVSDQMKMRKLQGIASTFPLSENYLTALDGFRSEKVNAEILQINKNTLSQFVAVSKSELDKFLGEEVNKKRIESMFNERKEALTKSEEITASHILLTTEGKDEAQVLAAIQKIAKEATPRNFATLANKHTEDPSGKENGGSLGSFGKGMMVPEFEAVAFSQKIGTISAPVKTNFGYHIIYVQAKSSAYTPELKTYEAQYAKEIIQKDKIEDLKTLTVDIANQARKALEAGKEAEVKSLASKYKLSFTKGEINRLDGASNGIFLSADNMKAVFGADITKSQFHSFDDGTTIMMVKTAPATSSKDLNAQADSMANHMGLRNALARKMMDTIVKELEEGAKVKVNNNVLSIF